MRDPDGRWFSDRLVPRKYLAVVGNVLRCRLGLLDNSGYDRYFAADVSQIKKGVTIGGHVRDPSCGEQGWND